jgi:hypothetical protein
VSAERREPILLVVFMLLFERVEPELGRTTGFALAESYIQTSANPSPPGALQGTGARGPQQARDDKSNSHYRTVPGHYEARSIAGNKAKPSVRVRRTETRRAGSPPGESRTGTPLWHRFRSNCSNRSWCVALRCKKAPGSISPLPLSKVCPRSC